MEEEDPSTGEVLCLPGATRRQRRKWQVLEVCKWPTEVTFPIRYRAAPAPFSEDTTIVFHARNPEREETKHSKSVNALSVNTNRHREVHPQQQDVSSEIMD